MGREQTILCGELLTSDARTTLGLLCCGTSTDSMVGLLFSTYHSHHPLYLEDGRGLTARKRMYVNPSLLPNFGGGSRGVIHGLQSVGAFVQSSNFSRMPLTPDAGYLAHVHTRGRFCPHQHPPVVSRFMVDSFDFLGVCACIRSRRQVPTPSVKKLILNVQLTGSWASTKLHA